mgnify:CR=1 FL=1
MALTDQQIRDLGILYLPLQQYLKDPFKLPEEKAEETAALPVNLTSSNVGSGGGGISAFDELAPTFLNERRPAPTTDFNVNPAAFLTGKGRTDPMGSDMDYFLNLPPEQRFSFGFRDFNIPGSPNYQPPDQFFEEPGLINKGIGIFKDLFKPRRFRGELGDRLLAQYNMTSRMPSFFAGLANFRSPFNPKSPTYNPDLVGQLNYLEGQDGLIGQSSVGLKYGPESVLFGKNVISGFGTNDYEEALEKYIEAAKLKLRRTTNEDTRAKIQKRIDKGQTELDTYLDKSGVQQERDDKRQSSITKEKERRKKEGDTTRAGGGAFGGGKDAADFGSSTSTGGGGFADADFGPAEGEFAGLKKGGLAGILYG